MITVKVLLWVIAVPLVIFAMFFVVELTKQSNDKRSPVEKIEQACRQEFGSSGMQMVEDCKLRLMLKALREQDRDRLDRAERQSR